MRVRPGRVRRLRIRRAMRDAALAGAVLVLGCSYLALEKNVTLVVDGRPQAVRTLSGSVGQLLDASGIALDRGGVVVPSAGTPLADGMTVVVDTAVPHRDVGVWVMEGTGGPLVKLAAQSEEDPLSAVRPVEPSPTVPVTVVALGKDHDVLTNAATVGDLLSAMGIRPDRSDRVLPSPSTPLHPGMLVRYVHVEYRTHDVAVRAPYWSTNVVPTRFRDKIVNGRVAGNTILGRAEVGPQGTEEGEASWYDAPGNEFTAAHPWLPFGTVVTVTDLDNGKSVQVVINDRGPFGGRVIDLSPEAFQALTGNLGQGICQVRLSW